MSTLNGVDVFNRHTVEYDRWFDENRQAYQAEVKALRSFVPPAGLGVEVGIGTARFATPLGIQLGVEPARNMALVAKAKNTSICQALGEHLPFIAGQFDFVLLVTVICFVKDVALLLQEVGRIIKFGGRMILGFIDRDSALGKLYESRKASSRFYKEAHFYSAPEVATFVQQAGFAELQFCQTIFEASNDREAAFQVRTGCGEGAFVAISAIKSVPTNDDHRKIS